MSSVAVLMDGAPVMGYEGLRPLLGTQVSRLHEGTERSELPWRLDLMNHSPTGLEWGYGGSGPSQLALAILADATGDEVYAKAKHFAFKVDVVTGLPCRGFFVNVGRVLDWVEAHPLTDEERELWRPWEDADREIAESLPSECCRAPCTYRGERNAENGYRAWSICSKCEKATEF